MIILLPFFYDLKVRRAVKVGTPIALNIDAHSAAMKGYSRYGIFIARHAGLRKNQISITWLQNLIKFLLKGKRKIIS